MELILIFLKHSQRITFGTEKLLQEFQTNPSPDLINLQMFTSKLIPQ